MAGKSKAPALAPPDSKAVTPPPARQRSVAEIEADIEATRTQLVETVSQLQIAFKRTLSPARIISVQITRVRTFYVDEYGGVRPERVVVTVAVVVGFFAVRKITRRIFRSNG